MVMNFRSLSCFFLILVSMILISCERESSPSRDGWLTAGSTIGMLVNVHDTVLVGSYHMPLSYFLDVDRNGSNDFEIISNVWGSPGMGQHPEADLVSLDPDWCFSVFNYPDTLFYHYQADTFEFSRTEIYFRNFYSCYRLGANDSVLRVQQSQFLNLYERNQHISGNGEWAPGKIDLTMSNGYGSNVIVDNNDTLKLSETITFADCHVLPNDRILWIGICKKEHNEKRLGWIRLSMTDNFKISVLESAIQE